MNLLLALFLILSEACFEGLRARGCLIASELVELVYLAGVSLMAFGWLNRKYIFKEIKADRYIVIIIGYFLLRFGLFDTAWNIAAGQSWDYYGGTKLYDRVMVQLGAWGWMLKGIAGLWGIAWLMGWREGIVKIVNNKLNRK